MSDRLAVVTGTSAGIGAALADLLLERGWTVVGLSRRTVTKEHPAYSHIAHDLADPSGFQELADRLAGLVAERPWSRVGVVNNAATVGQLIVTSGMDPDALAPSFAVNLLAPIAIMSAVVRGCPADTPLRIVNVSSGAARAPFPGMTEYCAAKAGLRMAGQILGAEVEGRNVAVLSYEPGIVETNMQEVARSASADDFPSSEMFHHFQAAGIAITPRQTVPPMADFLDDDGARGFSEIQYTG